MYLYKRAAETLLRKMSEAFKVLIVVEPRQVGKSTIFLFSWMENCKEFSFFYIIIEY